MNSFEHLVFDLDDTLLDTYGQLVPVASREACSAMIRHGLATDLAACLSARDEIAQTSARGDLFATIARRFGVSGSLSVEDVASKGFEAFYERRVETHISLFAGAREMLHDLKSRYALHLVTAGHPTTQEEKLKILELRAAFDSVEIVNTFANQTKSEAFSKIARTTGATSSKHLSVGNRLDTDIAPAKNLGWATCWVKYGEYARSTPSSIQEKPDYTITSINDLISTCRL